MIEVEAKIRISNPSQIKDKIKKIAKFVGKERKKDIYYTLEPLDRYPRKSLRIRKKKDSYEVNIKKALDYKDGVHAKREIELKSIDNDVKKFIDIIGDFGFKQWLEKDKTTELYQIGNNKNFHIEINKVKRLGWFLEIEYLVKGKGEIDKARKEIGNVRNKLGINEEEIVKDGYTKMLWDLMH